MDLNVDYHENFKQACELADKEFTHEELIDMLKNGNIPEKQLSALRLDCVRDVEEGMVLISNLTGCDGKIREAVALKINKLLTAGSVSAAEYFSPYPEIFANASIDINANICRLVIDSVAVLKVFPDFSAKYLEKTLGFIEETFNEIDKFIFRDKKYVINKQIFKLYWCLESLKLFVNELPEDKLFRILEKCSDIKEYTVREKAAQILALTENDIYKPLAEKLKQDENYYVRAALEKAKI